MCLMYVCTVNIVLYVNLHAALDYSMPCLIDRHFFSLSLSSEKRVVGGGESGRSSRTEGTRSHSERADEQTTSHRYVELVLTFGLY